MDAASKKEYQQILDLQFITDYTNSKNYSPQELYNAALSEALELLLIENQERYKKFEDRAENRIDLLEKNQSAPSLFIMAEIRLQWSFIHLKFGEELDAAWDLRQAYQLTKLCKKNFPDFKPILKTSGMLNVMVGSVPEKYDWILSLLGMDGDISKGIEELTWIQEHNASFSAEARLLKSLVEGYVFQQPKEGIQHIEPLLNEAPTPALALVLATALSLKNSESEKALLYINQLEQRKRSVNLAFIQYLKGEANLQKGNYSFAINGYQNFIEQYVGENHLKDAYYKTGLCYWLNNDEVNANANFSKAATIGREETEADKYAAHSLEAKELPNRKLTKVRYFTDGGYYEQANAVIETISQRDLVSAKDAIEFHYRKARLYHKTNNSKSAIECYQKTIEESNGIQTYYAPNACLQLGYLYDGKGDAKTAEMYFKKALTYKKHEYKNSIDSKARSALAQLNARK